MPVPKLTAETSALLTNLRNKECAWVSDIKEVFQTSSKRILYTTDHIIFYIIHTNHPNEAQLPKHHSSKR